MSKSEKMMKSESSTKDKIESPTKHAEDRVKDIFIKLGKLLNSKIKL